MDVKKALAPLTEFIRSLGTRPELDAGASATTASVENLALDGVLFFHGNLGGIHLGASDVFDYRRSVEAQNSAIGYITPKDMLAGHQQEIQADRDRKLRAAREHRKNRRQRAA
jgi:hypothetical protein